MGFLDKVVDVLGFVEKEEYDTEESTAEKQQAAPKVTAMPVKAEPKPFTRVNYVVSFNSPNRDYNNRPQEG